MYLLIFSVSLLIVSKNASNMKMYPKIAWDNAKSLREGRSGHHAKKKTTKFRNKDGVVATNDKGNAEIVRGFLEASNRDAVVY